MVRMVGGSQGELGRTLPREAVRRQRPWRTRERPPNSFLHWPPASLLCGSGEPQNCLVPHLPSAARLSTEAVETKDSSSQEQEVSHSCRLNPVFCLSGFNSLESCPREFDSTEFERGGVPQLNTPCVTT